MKNLVESLVAAGTLRSQSVIDAFSKVDRVGFVPEGQKPHAYDDRPLPIGFDQTISQPTTVAFMLENLDAKTGEKILDVGFGSGWQTALLREIVGEKGQVFAVERVKSLFMFGKENVAARSYKNVKFKLAGEKLGWPEEAPFDRIIVAAAAGHPPSELLQQLKVGGRCVIPVKNSILQIDRVSEDQYDTKEFPGFAFVPLIRY
ncbi:protein-L-isoaspartate(D-aspartate) O-methyltransferase [Patescibacteria group bacterium]